MLFYYIIRDIRSWRLQVFTVTMAAFPVFLIGLSRKRYLQIHYLSDVLAGFAGRMFWLSMCITELEGYRRSSGHKPFKDVISRKSSCNLTSI